MKKIVRAFALVIVGMMIFASCAGNPYVNRIDFNQSVKTGSIGAFELTTPTGDGSVKNAYPVFEWSVANNAETYTLEVAYDAEFLFKVFTKAGIADNSFVMKSPLKLRTQLFWRVTAVNGDTTKSAANNGLSFSIIPSGEDAEVGVDLGRAQDFFVNEVGMPVGVSILSAQDDVLGTGKPTLKLSYNAQTPSGKIEWGVVSKNIGANMSANNALKVTFKYTGGDATFALRLLEQDSDLWIARIAAAQGKDKIHTVVIPFDELSMREDESFGDRQINFNMLIRMDITISCSDSGEFFMSDFRSVNLEDYAEESVTMLDVGQESDYAINSGGYALDLNINKQDVLGNGLDTVVLSYNSDISPIGWGDVGKQYGVKLAEGNAFALDFMYEGTPAGEFNLRIVEGDGDMWYYAIPYGNANEVTHIEIPYSSMSLRTDVSTGDGQLQMDRVLIVNYSIGGAYSQGKAYYGNLRVISLAPQATMGFNNVFGDDMIIQRDTENFELYGYGEAGKSYNINFDDKDYSAVTNSQGDWAVSLPGQSAGGNYTISISDENTSVSISDITFGDVYLAAGQSNMLFKLSQTGDNPSGKDNSDIRLFTQVQNGLSAPSDSVKSGRWRKSTASSADAFSAVAWYFASEIQASQQIPVGILWAAVGDTFIEQWMSSDIYNGSQTGKNMYYNGMIAPLTRQSIKGVLWYQGENNGGRPNDYERYLTAMIGDLRDKFDNEQLPFFIVQLPLYNSGYNWAYVREAQQKVADSVPYTYMAVTIDGGDADDIHPVEKKYISSRLAKLVLNYVYGESILCDSPKYVNHTVNGDVMIITLSNSEGLQIKGSDGGFELAGADGQFYPAQASISGDKLELRASKVAIPVNARYAFGRAPKATLFNGANLAAAPFRTYTDNNGIVVDLPSADKFSHNENGNTISVEDDNVKLGMNGLKITYGNDKDAGWAVTTGLMGEIIGTGDYLSFVWVQEGNLGVKLNIRLRDADGDLYKATMPSSGGADGRVYIKVSDLVRVDGSSWGDSVFDRSAVITDFDIVADNCYDSGKAWIGGFMTLDNIPPQPSPYIIKSFSDSINTGDYALQNGDNQEPQLSITTLGEKNALRAEFYNNSWTNVWFKHTPSAFLKEGIGFTIKTEGMTGASIKFAGVLYGYIQYSFTINIEADEEKYITIPLSGMINNNEQITQLNNRSASEITHFGLSVSPSAAGGSITIGEIIWTEYIPEIIKPLIEFGDVVDMDDYMIQVGSGDEPSLKIVNTEDFDNGNALNFIFNQNDFSNVWAKCSIKSFEKNAIAFRLKSEGMSGANIRFVIVLYGYIQYYYDIMIADGEIKDYIIPIADMELGQNAEGEFIDRSPSEITHVGFTVVGNLVGWTDSLTVGSIEWI